MFRQPTWILVFEFLVTVVVSQNEFENNNKDEKNGKPVDETNGTTLPSSAIASTEFWEHEENRKLILYGLNREYYETPEELKKIVLEIFNEQMGLVVSSAELTSVRRFDDYDRKKQVSITVKTSWRKTSLLKRSKKLTETGLSLAQDYPPSVREKRRRLFGPLQFYRKKGRHAVLRYDKLYVEGVPYEMYDGRYIRYKTYRDKARNECAKYDPENPEHNPIQRRRQNYSYNQTLFQQRQTEQLNQTTERHQQTTEQHNQTTEQLVQTSEQHQQITEQHQQTIEQHNQTREQLIQTSEQHQQITEQHQQITEQLNDTTEQHKQTEQNQHTTLAKPTPPTYGSFEESDIGCW